MRQPRPQLQKDKTVTITGQSARRVPHNIAGPVLRVQGRLLIAGCPEGGGVKWVRKMVEGAPGL